ncbi:hypothetical protein GCM10029963_53980 [Micromonospora andamanensis]
MTVPAPRVRRRPRTPGRLLPLLLAIALLLPVAFLVVQAHQFVDTDRDVVVRERLGVEYLRALGPVTDALVDAQSAAVTGRSLRRDTLDQAVERAATVDARIGGELSTSERWAGLRAKLEALPERSLADPEAAFTVYGEVTDLLLALHGKVRETSGLIRDSGVDAYFLQDGVGEEMPEAVVAAGRLTDLTVLMNRRPAAERVQSLSQLATLRGAALQPANDLANNLRSVVENTESADLGATVLTPSTPTSGPSRRWRCTHCPSTGPARSTRPASSRPATTHNRPRGSSNRSSSMRSTGCWRSDSTGWTGIVC